jgi:hypothetical protein
MTQLMKILKALVKSAPSVMGFAVGLKGLFHFKSL